MDLRDKLVNVYFLVQLSMSISSRLTFASQSTLNYAELDTLFTSTSVSNVVNQRLIAVRDFTEDDLHVGTGAVSSEGCSQEG